MKIFIDHYPDQAEFAKYLAKRIKQINAKIEVSFFSEVFEKSDIDNSDSVIELNQMTSSDIVVTIVTEEYLEGTRSEVKDKLNAVYENPKQYLFPFIYSQASWAAINWIVRSKIIPEGEIPYIELTDIDKEKSINQLINAVKNISFEIDYDSTIAKPDTTVVTPSKIVFISHDHDDADFAELLKLQLEKENIIGWMDNERLKIGQDWRKEIDESITNAIAVIVIMTPEARKSEYVTYEWAYAWGKNKKIFPVMLKQTPLHPRLESLQYLDFTNRVTRPWEKLLSSLKELH